MKFSKIPLAQTITQLCLAKEIKHIVICPGSRNAPLTIGFSENENFEVFSIVDERSAAFFALGIAQQTKHPVVVVCTSGSAVLNFYPAIAEAFYSDIPLVVISADRPSHFIDIGDGQTIRQENVFVNHILFSANLKMEAEEHLFNETQINIAINTAIELRGPVHINAPFEEPLYEMVTEVQVSPQHVPARNTHKKLEEDLSEYISIWNNAKKKIILVGVLHPDSIEQKWLDILSRDASVLVLTETTSNIHHPCFINSIDQLIASLSIQEFKELQPEIVLTFGGMVVSKKIKSFLREFPAKHHWHVDEKRAFDTYFYLERHFKVSAGEFLSKFLPQTESVHTSYQNFWVQVKKHREKQHTSFIQKCGISDLKVFDSILKSLPDNSILQLSNSAAIRYAQLFTIKQNVEVYCNRGTSGIDGSTSTAVGAAYASGKRTTFITGDLSFFYDVNGLWNNYIPKNFRVVLINNNGGGIFRILPGEKDTQNFDTFFETTHQLNAKNICAMHHVEYTFVATEEDLNKSLETFYLETETPKLLEIQTPRKDNDAILNAYFKFLK